VDVAHIEPFAENQNDNIENGLALCKNAHWRGRVWLSPQRFTENGPEGLRLQPYAGRLLQFAGGVTMRPRGHYFTQRRKHYGMRA